MNLRQFLITLAALALAGCDLSSTAQNGTSSETQTSLQELATRLDGLRGQGSAARKLLPAARGMSSSQDSSTWTDLWAVQATVSYSQELGQHRRFSFDSTSNTFTSPTTYQEVRTSALASEYSRSEGRFWWGVQACPESSAPPPHCRSGIPGQPQMDWGRLVFRNGTIITPADSSITNTGHILDNRWTIQPNNTIVDSLNTWWDIYENGYLIGHGKQTGRSFSWSVYEDTFISSLASMTIFNLLGEMVPPDKSKEGRWIVFPEDSMGFTIESVRIDSPKNVLHLEYSWSFYPSPAISFDSLDFMTVGILDSVTVDNGLANNFDLFLRSVPIRSPEGRAILDIPLDSIHVLRPTSIEISISNRVESNVGTRSQTRFEFSASCEAPYPTLP